MVSFSWLEQQRAEREAWETTPWASDQGKWEDRSSGSPLHVCVEFSQGV